MRAPKGGATNGPRDAKIEDVGGALPLGTTPPQKSLFFVAWNHCMISEKTQMDRGQAFGGRDEREVHRLPHVMWSSLLLYPHCSLASHTHFKVSKYSRLQKFMGHVRDHLGEFLLATATAACTCERISASKIPTEFLTRRQWMNIRRTRGP